MSIAPASFHNLAVVYLIGPVQTIDQTRRERLEILIKQYGSIAELNVKVGLARTDATLSQVRNQAAHSKSGKPRAMGDPLARRLEHELKLPSGWMDTPPGYADLSDHRIGHVIKVMEAMAEWQRDQAVKIVDTLAEPAKPNGTHG